MTEEAIEVVTDPPGDVARDKMQQESCKLFLQIADGMVHSTKRR